MSCFGCISLEFEYQTSCHKYRHFTHFSNRLLAPEISPFPTPNFSAYIYDFTAKSTDINGSFSYLFNSVFFKENLSHNESRIHQLF